jgi:hypothetical protein
MGNEKSAIVRYHKEAPELYEENGQPINNDVD